MQKTNTITTLSLEQKILQSLLYFGESVSFTDLGKFTNTNNSEIQNIILSQEFQNILETLNLNLIVNDTHLELVLHADISKIINKQKINNLKEDLSESSLEVLSIVLYKEKASKAEIDFVRGVDSSRSIKALILRGLIEKVSGKNKNIYIPSLETLKYLNINRQTDLIEFTETSGKLKTLIEGNNE